MRGCFDGRMHRLVVVEGIPGSGKTTAAAGIADRLRQRGLRVALHQEGDRQPVDLAWQWWLTTDEYRAVLAAYPGAAAELARCAWTGRCGVSVAYTAIDPQACGGQWPQLSARLADREPYGGRLTADAFVEALACRWAELGRAPHADVIVLDAALLQDSLVELVLVHDLGEPALLGHVSRLAMAASALDPLVVRLVVSDVAAAVAAASAARVDADGRPWWEEAASAYVVDTTWARTRGLTGTAALVGYLTALQQLEGHLLEHLPLRWVELGSPAGCGAAGSPDGWRELEGALDTVVDELFGPLPEPPDAPA